VIAAGLLGLLGLLGPIEGVLEELLIWLHETAGFTWAWSIVALTIMVRVLLVPLMVRQIHSMQQLQRHAPEMKALQQKYKGDRQRLNEELMKFYKENKINPAASCLPIVAQLPVFIALFFVLRDFDDEIRPRFPDSDLSWLGIVPDITAPANSHWSGFLLLAIYAVSQLTSSYLMSTTMERTQRVILIVLPLAFLFFILNFPSGLVLYWVTTNLWTTGQGIVTRRLVPKPTPPPKRTSRTPARADEVPEDGAKPAKAAAGPAPAPPCPPRRVRRKKKARR
jgi:YidC/Oxa1 family membrane protein insertase